MQRKHITEEDSLIGIHDLDLVAALICTGIESKNITNENGQVKFFFNKNDYLKDVMQSFWNHNLKISPLQYANVRKNIKAQIYAMK